jgi:hypothetical protein
MAKKTNPRKRPVSLADYNKALHKGWQQGIQDCIAFVLDVLKNKHDVSDDDLEQFAREINYAADSVNKKYARAEDFVNALKAEHDITIDFVGGG